MQPRVSEAYVLVVAAARRRRESLRISEQQPRLSREEIAEILEANHEVLAQALDRTPFVPPDNFWPDTGVVTREEAAIMRRAARSGLNVDFIPLNARIRPPRDHGAA